MKKVRSVNRALRRGKLKIEMRKLPGRPEHPVLMRKPNSVKTKLKLIEYDLG